MTQFEKLTPDWLSVREALSRVLARARFLDAEAVSLTEGLGRALAEPVTATATLPPWDNSAMDGYAVRHSDLTEASAMAPVTLEVVGEIKAGDPARRVLRTGEAIRVMTGAPIPQGADAVVRVEDTDAEATGGMVRVFVGPELRKDIRPGGQDMARGDEILPVGTTIGPGQIGLLAATGANNVTVRRRPLVAVLSNGDEIAPASEFHRVMAGEAIPETNSPTLAAAVRGAGGVPIPLGIARDTKESILEKVVLAQRRGADVLLTSGGASMGEFDLFKRVLNEEGFELDFWRVKMRPGTPFSFGLLPGKGSAEPLAVFGLPGNPASSFVTFQILCRPYLLRLAGHERIHRPVVVGRAGEGLRSPASLTHFFRVTLHGDPACPVAKLAGSQTSGLVRGQGLASGLAVLPEGTEVIPEGDPVRVVLLDDFGLGGGQAGYFPECS
ncbi:MAG: molybdopterin molybdotransferase MoeA [Gemmatimonadetes bacterium]|nr:molybdopterin molybdotransferase MoeA [Gemmatimonadota bacterium]